MLWFSGGFLLSFAISVVAAVFFAKPLSLMLPMTHILILAGFFTVLVYAWRDKTQEGKLRMPEVFWGLCLFVATAAGALVSFYFGAIRVYALLFRIAALLFVSALSMGTMRRALREGARVRQFEKLTQIIPGGICRLNCGTAYQSYTGTTPITVCSAMSRRRRKLTALPASIIFCCPRIGNRFAGH